MATLSQIRQRIRQDLKDTDSANYRWTDAVLDRHIDHAVREFSLACPRETKATLATTSGGREVDISSLADRVILFAVEYPMGKFPPRYQRFSLYQDTITLLGEEIPDGSNCCLYYGKLHTLDDTTSTIPSQQEDTIALGSEAYALIEYAAYTINRISVGGEDVARQFQRRGEELLNHFKKELKKLNSHLRPRRLYPPATSLPSKSTDWGP